MLDVKIYNEITDEFFLTKMPIVPEKGQYVGCWFQKVWHIGEVTEVVYEFDEDGKFLLVEITAKLES